MKNSPYPLIILENFEVDLMISSWGIDGLQMVTFFSITLFFQFMVKNWVIGNVDFWTGEQCRDNWNACNRSWWLQIRNPCCSGMFSYIISLLAEIKWVWMAKRSHMEWLFGKGERVSLIWQCFQRLFWTVQVENSNMKNKFLGLF